MKTESQVINELERLGGAMASGPSLVGGVMDRLDGLPPPVRTSARPVRIVLACSFAAAACLLVALTAWLSGRGGRSPLALATAGAENRETALAEPQRPVPPAEAAATPAPPPSLGHPQGGKHADPVAQMSPVPPVPPDPQSIALAPAETPTVKDCPSGSFAPPTAGLLVEPPLAHTIARVKAAVRAEMVETEGTEIIVHKINKLIYGRVPSDTLRVRGGTQYFEVGKQRILFVYREYIEDGTVSCGAQNTCLDEGEKNILQVVESGEYLRPRNAHGSLGFYIRKSERIVRARLVKLDGTTSRWEVSGILYVRPAGLAAGRRGGVLGEQTPPHGPATMTLSLEPWQLRAEAIVGSRHTQAADGKATEEEFRRLVGAELKVGREAILFLRATDYPEQIALDTVLGMVSEDPDDPKRLGRLAESIRNMVHTGEHRNVPL